MPQDNTFVENGVIWRINPDGTETAIGYADQPIGGEDPTFQYQAPKAEADLRNTESTIRAREEANRLAQERLALDREKFATSQTASGANLTPAQMAIDRAYAQEYVDWNAAGGYAGLEGNLRLLEGAIETLKNSDTITGPVIGRLPAFIQQAINPDARDVRADVERVIQQSLKQILGAQFAMREADQLFARSFDPTQPEQSNINRIETTIRELRERGRAKESAARYYEENGTIAGWTPRQDNRPNAMTMPRLAELGQETGAAGRGAETTAVPIPDRMQREYSAFVAQGDFTPEEYAAFRMGLDSRYGFEGSVNADTYLQEGARILEGLQRGGTQNLTIPAPERQLSEREQRVNNLTAIPGFATLANAGNMTTFGLYEALGGGDNLTALNADRPLEGIAGSIAGGIGGTALLGQAARQTVGRVAPNLLGGGSASQFARNLGTDTGYGAIYGGVSGADPISGAALAAASSVGGQAFGGALGAGVGGLQRTPAAQALADRGIRMSVGRQLGGGAARAEDALQSLPVVGDMVRARQADSFNDFNRAAFEEAGRPIGFQPTQTGAAGVADLSDAVGDAYTNATRGVTAPIDTQFYRDLRPTVQTIRELPEDYRAAAETIMERRVNPAIAGGNITGEQYQQALRGIKQARGNAARTPSLSGFEQEYRDALTGIEDLLTGTMTRGAGPQVSQALGAANAANRGFKTVENAALDAAKVGAQTGNVNVFTPAQLIGAARRSENRGFGDNPLMELGRQGQEVLPSTLPNSGTADRQIMTGLLGFGAGAGALGGGAGYAAGGQDGAATGAGLAATPAAVAAALALLGTRGGQAGLSNVIFERPEIARQLGLEIQKRRGLFGSGATGMALGQ